MTLRLARCQDMYQVVQSAATASSLGSGLESAPRAVRPSPNPQEISQVEGANIEERFFKDRRYVDTCENGDIVVTFDLANGQQWKKRVWPRLDYPKRLLRRNSVEEILSYLISFERHQDWISSAVPQRPPSGSMLFFDRSVTKNYRSDGYEWKTRRTTSTVREDRMKLRVGGCQLVYACYAHSASEQDFHRRTYWLIQNPTLIMVHYLDSSEFCMSQISRYQPSTLPQHMVPTNWSMMTISDSNLCALLDMTNHASAAKNLLSRLPVVLSSSLQSCSTLEKILTTNNTGLPVDVSEEYSRSRKSKKVDAPSGNAPSGNVPSGTVSSMPEDYIENMLVSMNRNSVCSESSATPTPVLSTVLAMPVSSTVLTSSSMLGPSTTAASTPAEVVKVLSKSPHIIMCCPSNGSVSYILTVPTPTVDTSSGGQGGARIQGTSGGKGRTILRRIQAAPSTGQSIQPKIQAERSPSSCRSGSITHPGMQAERSPSGSRQGSSIHWPGIQGERSSSSDGQGRPGIQGERSPSSDGRGRNILVQAERSPSSSRQGAEAESGGSPMTRQPSGKGKRSRRISSKGKEKAVDDQQVDMDMLQCIQSAINGLLSPVAPDVSPGQSSILGHGSLDFLDTSSSMEATHMEATPSSMEATPTPTEHTMSPSISVRDYDPEKFSMFADFLVKMDPIENLSSLPEDDIMAASRTSRTGSFRSTESDSTTDVTGLVGHTPSSGFSTAAVSESQVTNAQSSNDAQDISAAFKVRPLDASDDLRIPEVPMSWLFSGEQTAPPNGKSVAQKHTLPSRDASTNEQTAQMNIPGMGFSLDLDSDNWQQLLDCSLDSPTRPGFSDAGHPHISELVNDLMVSGNTRISDPALSADVLASNSGVGDKSPSISQMLDATGGSSSWNGIWQDCNPGSIKNWLQSTEDAVEPTQTNTTGALPPTNPNLFNRSPPPPSSAVPENTGFPQELQDFIFESNAATTASISTSSPSSSHPSAMHDKSYLGDFFFDASSMSSQSPLADYASLPMNLDCLRPEVGEGRIDAVRKTSDVSVYSEPLFGVELSDRNIATHGYPSSLDNQLHLSLPDLTNADPAFPSITVADTDESGGAGYMDDGSDAFPCPMGPGVLTNVASSPSPNYRRSLSPSLLPDIPEGAQMDTLNGGAQGFFRYNSSIPSSPSASLSSSSLSLQEMFDDSPSVKELCVMLSESVSMQQADRMLTDAEQDQLFHAAETIQVAFRKYKSRNQLRNREKSAALLIEKYYKKYREAKEQKDQAARRIQHQYRIYKRRTRELNELSRAATFIQQMYRFHRTRRPSPYQRHSDHPD